MTVKVSVVRMNKTHTKGQKSTGVGMRTAIIADGGYILKGLKKRFGCGFETEHSAREIHRWFRADLIRKASLLRESELKLYRIYYYDCEPFKGPVINPVSGKTREPSSTYREVFLDTLEKLQLVKLQKGRLSLVGWHVKNCSDKVKRESKLTDEDLTPHFQQKEVDVKISLDVLKLCQNRTVENIIFITGDSDFVPLMEEARNHGITTFLCRIDKKGYSSLQAANDYVMTLDDGELNLSCWLSKDREPLKKPASYEDP